MHYFSSLSALPFLLRSLPPGSLPPSRRLRLLCKRRPRGKRWNGGRREGGREGGRLLRPLRPATSGNSATKLCTAAADGSVAPLRRRSCAVGFARWLLPPLPSSRRSVGRGVRSLSVAYDFLIPPTRRAGGPATAAGQGAECLTPNVRSVRRRRWRRPGCGRCVRVQQRASAAEGDDDDDAPPPPPALHHRFSAADCFAPI